MDHLINHYFCSKIKYILQPNIQVKYYSSMSLISEQFQSGQYGHCIKLYESGSTMFNYIELYFIAISYLFLGHYKSSQSVLYKIKKHGNELPDFNTYLAFNALKLSDYKKAKYYLDKQKESIQPFFYETNIELSLKLGQLRRVKTLINKADKLGVNSIDYLVNKAVYFTLKLNYVDAEKILLALIKRAPQNETIIDNLIKIYIANKMSNNVIHILEETIKSKPDNLKYIWKLLLEYAFSGDHKKRKQLIRKMRAADKENSELREILAIPSVYDSNEQISEFRQTIKSSLEGLIKKENKITNPQKEFASTPFFLSYHNDSNKAILAHLGTMFSRGRFPVPKFKKRKKNSKPKIGIISQHFYNNSVMDFYKNTLINLPDEFHVTMINISPFFIDETTRKLKNRADEYYQLSTSHDEIIPFVVHCQFDMIIYPEVGMSPCIYYLSMCRLAPIQTIIIGHPETSGSSQIDYYVSWKHFHNKDPKSDFTEQVIQLNEIPVCYDFPKKKLLNSNINHLNLHKDGTLFFIPMMIFKIHPIFDDVIVGIIKENPNFYIMIVEYKGLERVIINRLKKRLSNKQLDQIIISPHLKKDVYFSMLKKSDVILETFPFGGGNTMLQALAVGTPYVSLKSNYLRGSFGSGFYSYINETQFIAKTIDDYISIAINVATSNKIKSDFKKRVKEKHSKLFNNMSGSIEFYKWLESILEI